MLASTVQFSRYGRRFIRIFRVHQLVPFERDEGRTKFDHYGLEGRARKPAPSGLNSVPTNLHERKTTFHPATRAGVLMADVR